MVDRLCGAAVFNYGPLMSCNVPASMARQNAIRPSIWTASTESSIAHQAYVSSPYAFGIHSVVATVYGAVGTGSTVFRITRLTTSGGTDTNTVILTVTVNANTLAPQIFGPYRPAQVPVQQTTAGVPVLLYPSVTSTTWTQTSGGMYLTVFTHN